MRQDQRAESSENVRPWRVGRKVGRTIYLVLGVEPSDADSLIGVMDSPEIAAEAVEAHNERLGERERLRRYADQHDWAEHPYGDRTNWVCRKCRRSSYNDERHGMKRDERPTFYPAQCISGHGLTDTD